MPIGMVEVAMDTTDYFHVYRMTREADSIHWHLYIDHDSVAAVAHRHAAGNLLSIARIWFGDINFPVPKN